MANTIKPKCREDFKVAVICALRSEANAVEASFDEFWDEDGSTYGKSPGDPNAYTVGRIGDHNVVLAIMPGMGRGAAANVAASFRSSFQGITLALVVGICGGAPVGQNGKDIMLGDVVISTGIVEYDFGRKLPGGFVRKDTLNDNLGRPNTEIRALLNKLEGFRGYQRLRNYTSGFLEVLSAIEGFETAQYPGLEEDTLFEPSYLHKHREHLACFMCNKHEDNNEKICELAMQSTCDVLKCDGSKQVMRRPISLLMQDKSFMQDRKQKDIHKPAIHFGTIASGDMVMRSGEDRDKIVAKEKVIAFEMEGAGVWETFPCVVIKGVCDYSDSHKNKLWQSYAALTAAASMKAFLREWAPIGRPLVEVEDLGPRNRRIMNWLSHTPYEAHHREIRNNSSKGSCEWLLKTSTFREWINQPKSSILWLYGSPGAGKTFLTSKVAQELLAASHAIKHSAPVAYFYCSRDAGAPDRGDPANVLSTIIRQIACSQECAFIEPVHHQYQAILADGLPRPLTFRESIHLILDLLKYTPATIVIDGLDECNQKEIKHSQLLKELQKLTLTSQNTVKVFVASRDEPQIRDELQDYPKLMIDARDNRLDIEKYIDAELKKRIKLGSTITLDLEKKIKNTLIREADGIFRWVSLQLEALFDHTVNKVPEDIEQQLTRLPQTLKESYDVLYSQIQRQGSVSQKLAFRTIAWLLRAQQKLSAWELVNALNTERENIPSLELVTSICCNFVKYDKESDQFRLFHLSVTNYFEDERDDWQDSTLHRIVAEMCLERCLRNHIFFLKHSSTNMDNISFLDYANVYWPWHCEMADESQKLGNLEIMLGSLLSKFLLGGQSTARNFDIWDSSCRNSVYKLDIDYKSTYCNGLWSKHMDSVNNPMNMRKSRALVACAFGFTNIIDDMLLKNEDFNVRSITNLQPLYIAIRHKRHEIEKLLSPGIRHDLSVYVRSIQLEAAVETGNDDFVAWLFNKSTDNLITYDTVEGAARNCHPKTFDRLYGSLEPFLRESPIVSELLLITAVQNESFGEKMVQRLLPNVRNVCGNAYIAAAGNRNDGDVILRLLLNKGKPTVLSPAIVHSALGNKEVGSQIIKILIRYYPEWIPDKHIIAASAKRQDIVSLEILLDACPTPRVSQIALENAALNEKCGREMMELFLEYDLDDINPDDIVIAAMGNLRSGRQIVHTFWEQFPNVSSKILESTALGWVDISVIRELLDCFPNAAVDEITFIDAANNAFVGNQLLELFLQRPSTQIELYSSSVMLAMTSNENIDLKILDHFLGLVQDPTTLQDGLRNASRLAHAKVFSTVIKYIDSSHRLVGFLDEVAANFSCGLELVQTLLEKFPNLEITPYTIELAAANQGQGEYIISFLTDHSEETVISLDAVVAACENQNAGNLILPQILRQFNGNSLTDIVVFACASNRSHGFELMETVFKYNGGDWSSQPNLVKLFCNTAALCGNFQGLKEALRHIPNSDVSLIGFASPGITDPELMETLITLCDTRTLAQHLIYRLAGSSLAETGVEMMQRIFARSQLKHLPEDIYISTAKRTTSAVPFLQLLRATRGDTYLGRNLITYTASSLDFGASVLLIHEDKISLSEEDTRTAASNLAHAPKLLHMFWSNDSTLQVTEEILRVAASNWNQGAQALQFLGCKDSSLHSNITEEVLVAGASNDIQAVQILQFLWSKETSLDTKITEDVLKAASGNCSQAVEVLQFLWDKNRSLQVTEEILKIAASNDLGLQILQFLGGKDSNIRTKITEEVLKAAAGNDSQAVEVLRFLWSKESNLKVTQEVLEIAAGNKGQGLRVLQFLGDKCTSLQITQEVLKAAAGNQLHGTDIIQFLWGKYRNLQVTEAILEASAGNLFQGDLVLQFLWCKDSSLQITQEVLKAAASNKYAGVAVLRFLWSKDRNLQITQDVFEAAACNFQGVELLQFLWGKNSSLQITEEVLKAAAGNPNQGVRMLQFLWVKDSSFQITEEVISAAAGNISQGVDALRFLWSIESSPRITEEVLKSAAGNWSQGVEVMQFLLSMDSSLQITKNVIKAAINNFKRLASRNSFLPRFRSQSVQLLQFFQSKGVRLLKTPDMLAAAASNPAQGKQLLKLLGSVGKSQATGKRKR